MRARWGKWASYIFLQFKRHRHRGRGRGRQVLRFRSALHCMTRGETYHENDIVSLVLGEEGCVVHLELHGEYIDEGDCAAGIYGRMRSTRGSERRTERKGVSNVNERGVQERKAVHNASSDGGGRRERAAREAEAIISGCDGASRRRERHP